MEIKTECVTGFGSAVKWMRLPMESKGDSVFGKNGELVTFGEKDKVLASKLAGCKAGSGHNSFLKAIVVHAEFTATHDFILQLYRYHFRDTASSTSKMHSITKGSIGDKCSSWISEYTIAIVDRLIHIHNNINDYSVDAVEREFDMIGITGKRAWGKKELFECIIHNTPLGYELTFGEVTNYLQLKSMYKQRKSHKMSGWSKVFVDWVKTLPQSELITG